MKKPKNSRISKKKKLKLMEDDKEYVSEGEESYEPYGYELFIDALRKAEDKADYFKAGTK